MYANDGTIASPSIIDASKLTGLYGSASPVTVAALAHFQQVTYMASHVSYTKNHSISLIITQNNHSCYRKSKMNLRISQEIDEVPVLKMRSTKAFTSK